MLSCRTFVGAVTLLALGATMVGAAALDEAKYPDWGGQWKRPRGLGTQWDQGKPPGLGQQAPLTPEYQAQSRGEHRRPGGGRAGPRQPLSPACTNGMPRMMGVDLADRIRHPAEHHLHQFRGLHAAPHLHRRARFPDRTRSRASRAIRSANGSTPTATAASTRSRSKPATSRDRAPSNSPASRCTTTTRPSSRSDLSRQGQSRHHAQRDHDHRPRLHASLDRGQALPPRPQRALVRGQLHREQPPHRHRQRRIISSAATAI